MDESLESTPPRGSRLGKVRRRVLLFLLVVAVFVAFVPTILSTAALRQFVLSKVVPAEVGTASAQQLSLGWLTGIDVQGVVLTDIDGQKVFEADRLTVSRSLMNLAMDRRDLGEIRIHSPKIYVVTTAEGSNLEDLLTTVANLPGDESSSGGGPEYKLTLDEGEAYVADPDLGELWRIEDLQLVLNHPAAGGLEISAIGHVGTVDPQELTPTGPRGDAKLTLVQKPSGEQEAELSCHNLPLAAARPWLRRWDRNIQLTGVASGEGEASWQVAPGAEMSLATVMANSLGRFDVTGFRYQGLAVGQRQLDLPSISMPWNVSIAGGQLTAKQLRVETGAGTASMSGVVPIAAWSDRRALLAGTRASVDGDVSLPELTRLAPELIPLRQGAQVTAGSVRFRVRAEPEADALRVAADLETTSLAGQRQGKTIEWNAPLRVHVAARQFDKRVLVESANINSDFARLTLTGDRQQMRAEGSFNLNELSQRLGEFVDLGTVRLAGTGSLSGVMQLDDAGRFTAGGGGKLQDLVVSDATRTLVAESLVDWNVNCQGLYDWDAHLPKQFASGQLTLVAGNDEMTADLTGETQLASSLVETVWPIKLRLVGDVTNWQRRLEPFLALNDWALGGRATVTGEGRFRATPLRFALTTSQLNIEQLVAESPDYSIREPQVKWSGDLEFDRATGTLASKGGQLVGSTVSAGFRDLMWTLSESAKTKASGELAVRTDLARLAAWQKSKPSDTSRIVAKGLMTGNVKLAAADGKLRADLDMRGDQVVVARIPLVAGNQTQPPKPMQATLVGGVEYDPATDVLQLLNLQGKSQIVGINMQGTLASVTTRPVANVQGTLDYDLAKLTQLFVQPVTGPDVQIVGRRQAEFRLNGPLASTRAQVVPVAASAGQLTGSATVPWDSASVFGLPIGGGQITARLNGKVVEMDPLDFAVGGGRLTAQPRIVLDPEPAVLTLPRGPLLTNMTITPDVSNRMLKYIAPVLDQATAAEGRFSVRLDGATVPLADPRSANMAGQLAVSSVRVGPGPRVQPWVNLATQIEAVAKGLDPQALAGERSTQTALLVRDRTVDFRLVDGRVYHQGLEFEIGKVVVRSSGSVGLDETLDLRFDATHPELNGQSIQIPVRGTFSRMDMDTRALLRSIANSAIDNALEGGLNRALNRLFGDQ